MRLHRADRHRDGRLGRVDHRDTERRFERRTVPRHAGTAHDDDVGAVLLHELSADRFHAGEGALVRCRLGDGEPERALAR